MDDQILTIHSIGVHPIEIEPTNLPIMCCHASEVLYVRVVQFQED